MSTAGSQKFRTETRRLLDIVVNSLYSHPDVFLRELISNASDALDRLRFESLTDPGILEGDAALTITLIPDSAGRTLTVRDNGVGMTLDELSRNLGTIAGSGTSRFIESLEKENAPELIGRFGVGFYSAFMVADRVEVLSCRAGSGGSGARWESDGRDSYTAEPADYARRGTEVVLHLRAGMEEYLDRDRLATMVEAYSDYIPYPVVLQPSEGSGEVAALNSMTPLWLTPEKDVREGGYEHFYRHLSGDTEPPFSRLVYHGEGAVEFHALLFLPSRRPFEALMPEWRPGIDLYSRRVRIVEGCHDLLPNWLRFVRGVVESPDLPLNISRETLQQSPVLRTMGKALLRRIIDWLSGLASSDAEGYARFFGEFGDMLKEGLLSERDSRDEIARLVLAWTTADAEKPVLLSEFASGRPEDAPLFYVTGSDRKTMAASPHLETVRRSGSEVILFDSPVDELIVPALSGAIGRKLIPLDREELESELTESGRKRRDEASAELSGLLEYMRGILGAKVRDVRISTRLAESPCIVVPDRNDPGGAYRSFMKAMRHEVADLPGVLEINPDHRITGYMRNLFETARSDGRLSRCVRLVHQMGLVLAGSAPTEPSAFTADIMEAVLPPEGD